MTPALSAELFSAGNNEPGKNGALVVALSSSLSPHAILLQPPRSASKRNLSAPLCVRERSQGPLMGRYTGNQVDTYYPDEIGLQLPQIVGGSMMSAEERVRILNEAKPNSWIAFSSDESKLVGLRCYLFGSCRGCRKEWRSRPKPARMRISVHRFILPDLPHVSINFRRDDQSVTE